MTPEVIFARALLWFAIASLGMAPYFLALRRYRALATGIPALRGASTSELLETPQQDPGLEAARRACRRWLFAGVAIYFVCSPLLPIVLNA